MARNSTLASIEEILDDARNGRMVILVDDEDRENEGDLIIPAQMATPEAINFMAKHARGLICLALTRERCKALDLPLMAARNQSRLQTAFTVSIEASEGVTTGISAADRALTVARAIDPSRGVESIVTPGHVFPLMAQPGGVLVRAGHTEAAVDIARMAGLNPSGVICEIMNDDGTMARLPDLLRFADEHGLKVATIADLIAYRRRTEQLVARTLSVPFSSVHGGDWTLHIYTNRLNGVEHPVLVKGNVQKDQPTLVRMHALSVLDDVLGDVRRGERGDLTAAMEMIAAEGQGLVVLLRDQKPQALSPRFAEHRADSKPSPQLRDYGVGAQILLDLGVQDMILLSNTARMIVGLEGYGLKVVGQRPIPPERR